MAAPWGVIGLVVATAALLAGSVAVARRWGASAAERFWIAVAVAAAQVGVIAVSLSFAGWLTAPAWLGTQLGLAGLIGAWVRARPAAVDFSPSPDAGREGGGLWLAGTVLVAALAVGLEVALPLSGFDDRMYHASRVAYWLQHRSVLPFETHNDRQTVFSFGSELVFLLPMLFTKTEAWGRLFFAGGLPLAAVGLVRVIEAAGGSRRVAWAAALVFVSTPLVFKQGSSGLAPEPWLAVFVLGAAYWLVRARSPGGERAWPLGWAGVFVALAINVKFTAVFLLPGALVAAWWCRNGRPGRAGVQFGGGLALGTIVSGLLVPVTVNWREHGHPFGPAGMRAAHQSRIDARQLAVHAARLPFLLFDPPALPTAELREKLQSWAETGAARLGASALLPGESPSDWPGPFCFRFGPTAGRFSLAGMLWLPLLALALWRTRMGQRSPGGPVSAAAVLLVLQVPMLLGLLFLVRWPGDVNAMARFFVSPFALGVALGAVLLAEWPLRRTAGFLAGAAILLPVALILRYGLYMFVLHVAHLRETAKIDEPFAEALRAMPSPAHVLLVAQQDARDYGLFRPADQLCNQVFPWGKAPFTPERLRGLIVRDGITHVLVQNDDRVDLHWSPPVETAPMVAWLRAQPDLAEIPLPAEHQRLFVVRAAGAAR